MKLSRSKKLRIFSGIICIFFLFGLSSKAQIGFTTIDFESSFTNLSIDSSQVNNIWQIGKPQKIFFDSASSMPSAIVTDTINFYPNNDTSSFIVKITSLYSGAWNVNWPGPYAFISFMQKFDTDTITDGGSIEYSVDDGSNWQPVTYYDDYGSLPNIPNSSLSPHYTGHWNNWFYTRINFLSFANTYSGIVDSILVKFTFVSDGINNNKEGWIIDNIIYGTDVGEGILTNEQSINAQIAPNPFNTSTTIEIKGEANTPFNIIIYDHLGKEVRRINDLNQKKIVINREGLDPGMYFYSISDKNKQFISNGKLMVGN